MQEQAPASGRKCLYDMAAGDQTRLTMGTTL